MSTQTNLTLKELTLQNLPEIKELFTSVFTKEPWYDNWDDKNQLNEYLHDLMQTRNPVNLGLYDSDTLIGLSIGYIKHWCSGTEYIIDEFCIKTTLQNQGLGTKFFNLIEEYLLKKDVHVIYLLTEHDVPAYKFYKTRGFIEIQNSVSFYKEF